MKVLSGQTYRGIDTNDHGATLAPMHHAWLLLAAVAAPATALDETVIEKGADHEAYTYRPHPRLSPRL
jgi:hypothetical protein